MWLKFNVFLFKVVFKLKLVIFLDLMRSMFFMKSFLEIEFIEFIFIMNLFLLLFIFMLLLCILNFFRMNGIVVF